MSKQVLGAKENLKSENLVVYKEVPILQRTLGMEDLTDSFTDSPRLSRTSLSASHKRFLLNTVNQGNIYYFLNFAIRHSTPVETWHEASTHEFIGYFGVDLQGL